MLHQEQKKSHFKKEVWRWNQIFFFPPESQSPFWLLWKIAAHFSSVCFPSPLFFPTHSHLVSVNDQNLMEGLISGTVQRHPTSVLIVRRLIIPRCHHMPSCHLSEKQTCLCCKEMLKRRMCYLQGEKWRFERRDLGGDQRMQSEGTMSLREQVRHLRGVWETLLCWISTPLRQSSQNFIIGSLPCPCLLFFCLLG